MKILVARQDLEAALSIALTSMSNSGVDLSTHCLFRPSHHLATKAEVLTYSVRCFSRCPFVANVDNGSGFAAFTIEGKRLRKWVDAVPDVALTFEFDGKVVKATAPGKGTQKFESLNPDNWPYWDKVLEKADHVTSIDAARLAAALDHCRQFASTQENRNPELCVCECKDGVLASTDKIAAAFVTVQGLEKSSMRVHVKDAPNILSFLGSAQGNVDVLEGDTNLFFRRADGCVYGETKFQAQFPNFSRPGDADMYWWDLQVEDLKSGIPFLSSGAAWEDNRLYFNREDDTGPVQISMMTTSGSITSVDVTCQDSGKTDGAEPLPKDGFVLSHPLLTKVLSSYQGETIRLGINFRQKGGYVRVVDQRFNGDEYLTILAWLR